MEVETYTSPLDTNFSQCYEQNILICTGNRASQDDFSTEHAFFFFEVAAVEEDCVLPSEF